MYSVHSSLAHQRKKLKPLALNAHCSRVSRQTLNLEPVHANSAETPACTESVDRFAMDTLI